MLKPGQLWFMAGCFCVSNQHGHMRNIASDCTNKHGSCEETSDCVAAQTGLPSVMANDGCW